MQFLPVCKSEKCLREAGRSLDNAVGIEKNVNPGQIHCPDCKSILIYRTKKYNWHKATNKKCSKRPFEKEKFY